MGRILQQVLPRKAAKGEPWFDVSAPGRGPRYGLEARHVEMGQALAAAWKAHHTELAQQPSPQERGRVLIMWRNAINSQAHDYADLVSAHPQKDRILALESQTIMDAYVVGYMARQGWVEESIALQSAYVLGRSLRDGVRALGVSFNFVCATLGTVMAMTLRDIVKLGMQPDK